MFNRGKIFAVYEKPEASDPADRVVLLREGFAFWAFIFTVFWLIAKQRWWVLGMYIAVATVVAWGSELLHLSEISAMLLQLWLQLILGYHASDFEAWVLKRRGYRLAGLLAAESEMTAAQRYYEFAV